MIGTRPNYNNVIGLSLIIILPFHDKKKLVAIVRMEKVIMEWQ